MQCQEWFAFVTAVRSGVAAFPFPSVVATICAACAIAQLLRTGSAVPVA